MRIAIFVNCNNAAGKRDKKMKSIRLNLFYNIVLNVSKVLFPLITAPYVARVLSSEGLGLFNFSNTYAAYFGMVALLGIPTYGIREVSKAREDKERLSALVSELMSVSFLMTLGVTALYIASLFAIPQLGEDRLIFIIAGILLYLSPFKIDWFFSGLERFGFITMRSLVIKTLSIIALFVFVHTKEDLLIYVIINALSNVTGDVWNFSAMLKEGVRPRLVFTGLGKHMKPVLVLFASAVAISVYTVLDTIMLGLISDDHYSQVAYYNCASNISKMILAAVTSFSAVAIPRMSYYLEKDDRVEINKLVRKSFSVVSFLAIPAAMGIACIAPTFAPLFYGPGYDGAIIPLQVMAFVIVAIGLNNLSGVQILIGLGEDKLFLYAVVIGAVFNFSMNLILIPIMGATGASIASVAAETLIFAVTLYYVRKHTFVRIKGISDIVKSLAASLLFIPLIYALKPVFHGWVLVGVFCVLGFCLYVVMQQVLRNSSMTLFRDTLSSIIKKVTGR